jgi:multidrug efflux pump subunit AcrA (membrane-fusion protein)
MLGPPILGELRADIGDRVTAGTVVAVLASSPVLDAAAREADRAVEVARRRLAVVTSGEASPNWTARARRSAAS